MFVGSGIRRVRSGVPSNRQVMPDIKQVEYPGDDGVYQVINRIRFVIKWRAGGTDGSTGATDFEHVLQINLRQGGLTMHQ